MKEYFVLIKDVVVNAKNINYIKFANNTYVGDCDFLGRNFYDEIEDSVTINQMYISFVDGSDVAIDLDNDPQKAKEEFNQYVEVIMNKVGENNLLLD